MTASLLPRPLPFVTASLPGTGGTLKVAPEDFEVEEIPAYLPQGSGEHLYLWVEKRGLSTMEAAKLIAQASGTRERDVGIAGQKDRFAVTRQWMSIQTKEASVALDDERVRILQATRHRNRLKTGHLKGNRFRVVLRGVGAAAVSRARAVLDVLDRDGLPNFYGTQRFGRHGDNAVLGAALLGVGSHPQLERAAKDRHLRRLALSALQSELFNRTLTARLGDGLFAIPLAGDVLRKRSNGGPFVCEDPGVDLLRVQSGELDITGPMPGPKEHPTTSGEARRREDAVLTEAGLTREAFALGGGETEGARRPYRVPVTGIALESVGEDALCVSFELPAGSYATRVIAEIAKTGVALPTDG